MENRDKNFNKLSLQCNSIYYFVFMRFWFLWNENYENYDKSGRESFFYLLRNEFYWQSLNLVAFTIFWFYVRLLNPFKKYYIVCISMSGNGLST